MRNSGIGLTAHWLLGVAALLASACAERHVVLKFPDAAGTNGLDYTCSATDGPEKCVETRTQDPASDNRAGSVFVIVPRECDKHFNQITIHDSGSATPSVHVKCAPAENKIPALTPVSN